MWARFSAYYEKKKNDTKQKYIFYTQTHYILYIYIYIEREREREREKKRESNC